MRELLPAGAKLPLLLQVIRRRHASLNLNNARLAEADLSKAEDASSVIPRAIEFLKSTGLDSIAGVVTPFKVSGSLSDPKFQLQPGAGTAKVVGETVLLPFNLLGTLFSSDVKSTKKSRNAPCKPIKTATRSAKANSTAKPAKARPKTHNFSTQNRHRNRTR